MRAVLAVSRTVWIGQGLSVVEIDASDPEEPRERRRWLLAEDADVWGLERSGAYLLAATSSGLFALDPAVGASEGVIARALPGTPVRAVSSLGSNGDGRAYALAIAPGMGAVVIQVSPEAGLEVAGVLEGSSTTSVEAAVDGRRVVLASRDVEFLDLADPLAPVRIASLPTAGVVRGVATRDGIAYIADSRDGLLVHSMDSAAGRLGRLPETGAGRLRLHGSLLFLLEEHHPEPNTVRLIDVADPARPKDLLGGESTYSLLRGAQDLALSADLSFGARGRTLSVVDIRDVLWPETRSEYPSDWPVQDVAAAGDCVYLAESENGLGLIDVRVAAAPTSWGAWRPEGGVSGVHVADGFAYVATRDGLARVDARSACDPVLRESSAIPDWPMTRWLDSSGSLLAATSVQALYLARLAGDRQPESLGATRYGSLAGWPPDAVAQGIAAVEEALYVAAGPAGVAVVDVTDPRTPRLVRTLPAPEGASVLSVAASGPWLAAGTNGGVLVFDAASAHAPRLIGAHAGQYQARALAFPGLERLFVAADVDGLLALDLEDPAHPILRADWRPGFAVSDVAVDRRAWAPGRGGPVYAAAAGLALLVDRSSNPPPSPTTPATASPTGQASPTSTATPGPGPNRAYVPLFVVAAARTP